MARLYVEGIYSGEVEGFETIDSFTNCPAKFWPEGVKNVCIVSAKTATALVTMFTWGNALPEGPTGWNLYRVPLTDERVPETVKLAEMLI